MKLRSYIIISHSDTFSIHFQNSEKIYISLVHFDPHLSQKLLPETPDSSGKYRNSCSEVFYKSSCSEKCFENSPKKHLGGSFKELEVEVKAKGFFL